MIIIFKPYHQNMRITLFGIEGQPVDVIRGRSACHSDDVVASQWDCLFLHLGDHQHEDGTLQIEFPVQYLVKEDGVNASMKHGRLVGIVHGKSPDEALVDEVDALREAVVVGVDEEGALLRVAKRPSAGAGRRCQRLLWTWPSDCICGCTTKSWRRFGIICIDKNIKNCIRTSEMHVALGISECH